MSSMNEYIRAHFSVELFSQSFVCNAYGCEILHSLREVIMMVGMKAR